jgi:hypothetical protein
MGKVIFIGVAIFLWFKFFGDESGCEKYASKFSCSYVEEKATYEVFYWTNVTEGDEKDNKYVGSVVGLQNCRDLAIGYSRRVNDQWSERAYVCTLMKDGNRMEKHRL